MKKVFYSPGPTCGCDTYQVIDFDGVPTDKELAEVGFDMAYEHYESYVSSEEYEAENGCEIEYDYGWYDIDDPEVEGHV